MACLSSTTDTGDGTLSLSHKSSSTSESSSSKPRRARSSRRSRRPNATAVVRRRKKPVRYHFMCDPCDAESLRFLLLAHFRRRKDTYVINSTEFYPNASIIHVGDKYETSLASLCTKIGFAQAML